jgi:putative ABC transport system permease protein
MNVIAGRFLPDDDPRTARTYAVLGSTIRNEIFGATSPLGQLIRIGGERFRVIGVMDQPPPE